MLTANFASGLRPREIKEFFEKILEPIKRITGSVSHASEVAKPKKRRKNFTPRQEPEFDEDDEPQRGPEIQEREEAPKRAKQASFLLGNMEDDFEMPPVDLLREAPSRYQTARMSESALSQNARILEKVLEDFGVKGEVSKISPGPVVTLYEFEPAAGIKSSKVVGLAEDIARSMSAVSARIAVIPGQNAIGIELPNSKRETVYFREMMESEDFANNDASLPLALGKDIGGAPVITDLAKMPHLLVAGTTGSGKSVAINTMITSLLYKLPPSPVSYTHLTLPTKA